VGKFFIILGLVFVIIGVLINIAPRFPFIGRLPGDIFIKKENFTFYFPLTSSIILSVIFSIVFYLFKK